MPQRFLRPGLTTSSRFNSVGWEAQSLYVRLITLVDDYGRFDAHPTLLKSLAFPFNPEITCEQMFSWCGQLKTSGLVVFYEVDGKQYLQLARWHEKARSHSKFPAFDTRACEQMFANDNKCSPPSSSSSSSSSPLCNGKVAPLLRFQSPTIESIKLQATKIGLSDLEAEKFFNYYESNGWKVGRNPMKSWTHALTNWKNNSKTYGNNSKPNSNGFDRSIGTANEGLAKNYRGIKSAGMGGLVKVSDAPRPGVGVGGVGLP